jgi:hypothetical protein
VVVGKALKVLIVGGADCVWDDLAMVGDWPHDICAINDIGQKLPRVTHWVTLHPREWEIHQRRAIATGYTRWSHHEPCDKIFTPPGKGSSGLYAVRVMMHLGYTQIILAGVPMEQRPHFNKERDWADCDKYKKAWTDDLDEIKPFVRSCSGWTRRLLGGPENFLR